MMAVGITCLVRGFADFPLDLAGILFDIASGFFRVIAGDLAGHFLHSAFYFVFHAFGTILVHDGILTWLCVIRSGIDLRGCGITDA
jgi:hypothetical protein